MGKRQHFISRFILQYFTDENNFVWGLDKQTGSIFHVHPENIGYINHLYSIDKKKDKVIEDFFAEVEGKSASIIGEIIEKCAFPTSNEERTLLLYFLAIFNLRYPALISAFNDQNALMNIARTRIRENSSLSNSETQAFMEFFGTFTKPKNRFYASVLRDSIAKEYDKLVSKFNISLLSMEEGEFIISNEYKYFTIYDKREVHSDSRAYMYYPISPKVCIVLSDKKLPAEDRYENWSIRFFRSYPDLEAFNRDVACKNERFLYASNEAILDEISAIAVSSFREKQKKFRRLVNSLRSGVAF